MDAKRSDAPGESEGRITSLIEKTELYCTVLRTLLDPPPIERGLG